MGSAETFDLERLLAPISEESPAGVELKDDYDASVYYYQVKDAREAARAAERQLQMARLADDSEEVSIPSPDWKAVDKAAQEVLASRSKDLWIAAWLIEAQARLNGFAGVRDGFILVRRLCEAYWDEIHPRPDEDGIATTVAQLAGLNGTESDGALISPLEEIPIVPFSDHGAITSADYLDALQLGSSTDTERRAQRIEQGAFTLEMIEKAVAQCSEEVFAELAEDIEEAIHEYQAMCSVLDEKCGQDEGGYALAPPSSKILETLRACQDRLRSLTRGILGDAEETTDEEEAASSPHNPATAKVVSSGPIQTRDDAFRLLLQVADYFRKAEPHTPVSYALEQAVRWGRMSLPDLLTDLISDEHARNEMFRRAGIPIPEDDD